MNTHIKKRTLTTIIGIIGVLFIAIVIAVLVYYFKQQSTKQEEALANQQQEARLLVGQEIQRGIKEIEERDTDGDGLFDWEEGLWGTDPEKVDTDGDGISDFDFVAQEKQQRLAEEGSQGSQGSEDQSIETLDEIDILSRDLYTSMILLQQQGALENGQVLLADQFSEDVVNAFEPTPYTIVDVDIVDDSEALLLDYLEITTNYLQALNLPEQDLARIFNPSNQTQNADALMAIQEELQSVIEGLRTARVPVSAHIQHLELVKAAQHMGESLVAISDANNDPLTGLSALIQFDSVYKAYREQLRVWSVEMQSVGTSISSS